MARYRRYLTWHFPVGTVTGSEVGESVRLDRDYVVLSTRLYRKGPPESADVIIDVNADGETLYSDQDLRPRLLLEQESFEELVEVPELFEGSAVTVDIDQLGDGSGPITFTVELEEANDEE